MKSYVGKVLLGILFCGIISFFPQKMLAINLGAEAMIQAGSGAGVNTASSLPAFIGGIIALVISFLGVLLLIYFVYAGVLWMTARGDEKQIGKAKDVMKNSVIGLIITLSTYTAVVFLRDSLPGGGNIGGSNTETVATSAGLAGGLAIEDQIGLYINIILNLLGVVLLLFFIYAGILWMTAQGDEKQIGKAKDIMKNAVIGLILTLLAYSITSFVIDQISGRGTTRLDYGDSLIEPEITR